MAVRQKSLFNKLIICHCGFNYKKIMERKHPNYVCSNYSNYGNCFRNLIKEELLTDFIKKYCNREGMVYQNTNEFITSLIDKIEINKSGDISINYQDGYKQIISNNLIQF